jgi:phosphotransacetylase
VVAVSLSPVAGKADIMIAPNIEAGNMLYKALVFLAKAKLATSILGGSVPIVLTSRSDSDETKLNSIAFNVLLSEVVK